MDLPKIACYYCKEETDYERVLRKGRAFCNIDECFIKWNIGQRKKTMILFWILATLIGITIVWFLFVDIKTAKSNGFYQIVDIEDLSKSPEKHTNKNVAFFAEISNTNTFVGHLGYWDYLIINVTQKDHSTIIVAKGLVYRKASKESPILILGRYLKPCSVIPDIIKLDNCILVTFMVFQ